MSASGRGYGVRPHSLILSSGLSLSPVLPASSQKDQTPLGLKNEVRIWGLFLLVLNEITGIHKQTDGEPQDSRRKCSKEAGKEKRRTEEPLRERLTGPADHTRGDGWFCVSELSRG